MRVLVTLALIGLGGFIACTSEQEIGNPQTPGVQDGQAVVHFTLGGISATTRSYAAGTVEADEALKENHIDSVMVCVFTNEPATTTEPDANAILENIAVLKVETTSTGMKDLYTAQTLLINRGSKWFVVLANHTDTTTIYEGMIYSNFKQLCTPQTNELPSAPFIMSGMTYGTLNANTPLHTTIELTRAVTRIDITIRNSETVGGTNPFKLQQVRLTNMTPKGYLVWQSDGSGAFNEPQSERFTSPWIEVENKLVVSATADSLWHSLYTYEALAQAGKPAYLELKGLYRGMPAGYQIALTQEADNMATPAVPLRNLTRNHRYLVYIDSVDYVQLISEIRITDWDFTNRDTIPYNPETSFGAPAITIRNAAGYDLFPSQTATGSFKVDTIVVNENGYGVGNEIVFDLVSYNVNSEFYTEDGWITAEEVQVPSGYSTVSSDTIPVRQQFKIAINDTTAIREGYFELGNLHTENDKVGYVVIQYITGPTDPLDRFAKANLAEVGVFGPDLTAELAGTNSAESHGATFQWGRKVAFAYDWEPVEGVNTSATKISFADGATSNNWITVNPWHSESGYSSSGGSTITDLWTKLVSMDTAVDSDPCPGGWHVMTMADFGTIFPTTIAATNTAGVNAFRAGKYLIVDGYAIRWIRQTSLAGNEYMQVNMLPTELNNITTTNIADIKWNAKSIETRYFPATGYRNTAGTSVSDGTGGYYSFPSNNSTAPRMAIWSFTSSTVNYAANYRSSGFSVRCVTD